MGGLLRSECEIEGRGGGWNKLRAYLFSSGTGLGSPSARWTVGAEGESGETNGWYEERWVGARLWPEIRTAIMYGDW